MRKGGHRGMVKKAKKQKAKSVYFNPAGTIYQFSKIKQLGPTTEALNQV